MAFIRQRCGSVLWIPVIVLFSFFLPGGFNRQASAGIEEITGLGIRYQALAGAAVAINQEPSAAYYNPAGLSGITFYDDLGFNFESGVSRFDINAWSDSFDRGKNRHDELIAVNFINLSLSFDLKKHLGKYIGDRNMVFGITALVPSDNISWWRIQYPEEEIHPMYYDNVHRFIAIPGIGMEITPWLSIGMATNIHLEILFNSTGPVALDTEDVSDITENLDSNTEHITPLDTEIGIYNKTMVCFAPIFGIQLKPKSAIIIGLTFRKQFYMDDYGRNELNITMDLYDNENSSVDFPILYYHHFAHYFTPHQLALGFSMKQKDGFLLSADITYMKWSSFIDIFHETPEKKFKDVIVPRIGIEKPVSTNLHFSKNNDGEIILLAGYGFFKSPVPDQTGYTTYLDNDKHLFTGGCRLILKNGLGSYFPKPVYFQAMFQYHYLVERSCRKEETGETVKFGGYAYSTGMTVRFDF